MVNHMSTYLKCNSATYCGTLQIFSHLEVYLKQWYLQIIQILMAFSMVKPAFFMVTPPFFMVKQLNQHFSWLNHHFSWLNQHFSWLHHHFPWLNQHFSWLHHHFPWQNIHLGVPLWSPRWDLPRWRQPWHGRWTAPRRPAPPPPRRHERCASRPENKRWLVINNG